MKKLVKQYSYFVAFLLIIILFLATLLGYYITKNDLVKKLENTPYNKYGADWTTMQNELNLASLAENGEIGNNDLVKLSQEISFENVNTSNLHAKCVGVGDCKNCSNNSGKACGNVTLQRDSSLKTGEVNIKEYTKVLYFYTEEMTDIYFPKSHISFEGSVLNIEFEELKRELLDFSSVAFVANPRILKMFDKTQCEWENFAVQSVDKHFVVRYN